jgi:hypothetical protein
MKKVLAAALLCAASVFAAWDYFPVIEQGKGQGQIGSDGTKIRYSPMQNLEVFAANGNSTLRGYVTGARYQIGQLSAGADIALPIRDVDFGIAPNVQFSMEVTETVAFGVGADFGMQFADDTQMNLDVGGELDLLLGQITFWVGCNVGVPVSEDDADAEISPKLGAFFSKNNISLGTYLTFGTDDDIITRQDIYISVGF